MCKNQTFHLPVFSAFLWTLSCAWTKSSSVLEWKIRSRLDPFCNGQSSWRYSKNWYSCSWYCTTLVSLTRFQHPYMSTGLKNILILQASESLDVIHPSQLHHNFCRKPGVDLILQYRLVCSKLSKKRRETSKGSFATITSWLQYPSSSLQSLWKLNNEWAPINLPRNLL